MDWAALGLGLMVLCSCDYSSPNPLTPIPSRSVRNLAVAPPGRQAPDADGKAGNAPRDSEERTAILESSVTLIQRAALQPGGNNFELAVKKLNHYFEGTSPSAYQLEPPARDIWQPSCRPRCSKPRK